MSVFSFQYFSAALAANSVVNAMGLNHQRPWQEPQVFSVAFTSDDVSQKCLLAGILGIGCLTPL